MAEFAMVEAARRLAAHDQSHPDPGTHGDVREIVEPAPRAPAHLCQCSSVDVRVDCNGHTGSRPKLRPHVRTGPARLRRRQHMTMGWRRAVDVDWAEAGDAQRRKAERGPPLAQYIFDRTERRIRRGGRNHLPREHLFRATCNERDAFGAAEFDACEIHAALERKMVGVARIELATPAMSTQCSTTELHAHPGQPNGLEKRHLGRGFERRNPVLTEVEGAPFRGYKRPC